MMTEIVLVQKTVSKVLGDFVSKVVSDGVDALKDAIKNADLDRKSYNQNLQTRLYQLIIDALNRFTHDAYKKQDTLYDAAESILKGYISTKDNVDAVKAGLKMLVLDVNIDTCQEFLETLCGEICSDDNNDLYKEIDMLWKRRESEYIHGEFAKIDQNDGEILEQLNDLRKVLDFIKRNMNRREGDKTEHNGIPVVNRADEYAKRWNENVFLNNFSEEDENAGINIKLREIYVEECLPHYIWETNTQSSDKLKSYLMKYINNNEKKMLLILGQPGIGKSTLITWIMANLVENKKNVLIYQFASDLSNVNWQGNNLLHEIFATIGLKYNELDGKTLILDGFDEIYIKGDRERILHRLNQELEKKNYIEKFSLVITCRENYVNRVELKGIEYITLEAWDEGQIRSFCEIYEEVIISKDSESIFNRNSEIKISKIIEKKDIMGIPLILYMVLALNVEIERSSSTVDIYDQIFSLKKGGIYDRDYDAEHRINAPEIKKHIHHISQRIAFWMFENNADKATISQEKFKEICESEMRELGKKGEGIQSDTLIGNFFKLNHCEGKGTDELQFVHRSIYEYFVVIYFFESIHELKSKEEVAGKLGELLKDGKLSKQILEFIKYKFDNTKGSDFPDTIKEIFQIMLRDGMNYHVGEPVLNIMNREMNIFSSMLEVVGLWNKTLGILDDKIINYVQCNREIGLNLKGIVLRSANLDIKDESFIEIIPTDLRRVYLERADLSGADLGETDLSNADLSGADLSGADLSGADLSSADLRRANLSGANLYGTELGRTILLNASLVGTVFGERQVNLLCEKYNLGGSRVYLPETKEEITYEEYCTRKKA